MKMSGRAFIDIPGIGRVSSNKGASLETGGFNRPERISDVGVEGYTEEPVPAKMTCQIQHRAGLSLLQFNNLLDVNVVFQTDTGATWVMRESWTSIPVSISDGIISLEMMGKACDEVQA